jgi:hypothetical protein
MGLAQSRLFLPARGRSARSGKPDGNAEVGRAAIATLRRRVLLGLGAALVIGTLAAEVGV